MTRSIGSSARARSVRAGLLAAALVTLAACGSDDDGGSSASDSGSTSSASTTSASTSAAGGGAPVSGSDQGATDTLEVTAQDFSFDVPSDDLPAGDYTIQLTNDGSASHDLVVERDGADVAGTDTVGPGESDSLTVSLEPGEYVFYCSIGNHRAMGMEVTVTVT